PDNPAEPPEWEPADPCVEALAGLAATLVPGLAVVIPTPPFARARPKPLPNPPVETTRILAEPAMECGASTVRGAELSRVNRVRAEEMLGARRDAGALRAGASEAGPFWTNALGLARSFA